MARTPEQRKRIAEREATRRSRFTPEQRAAVKAYQKDWTQHRRLTDAKFLQRGRDQNRRMYVKHADARRESARDYTFAARVACLQAYSGAVPFCTCCGERRLEFLTLDHIEDRRNDNGIRVGGDRIGTSLYAWLKRMGFPLGFRVRCYNCNCTQGARGYCPHELELDMQLEAVEFWL